MHCPLTTTCPIMQHSTRCVRRFSTSSHSDTRSCWAQKKVGWRPRMCLVSWLELRTFECQWQGIILMDIRWCFILFRTRLDTFSCCYSGQFQAFTTVDDGGCICKRALVVWRWIKQKDTGNLMSLICYNLSTSRVCMRCPSSFVIANNIDQGNTYELHYVCQMKYFCICLTFSS